MQWWREEKSTLNRHVESKIHPALAMLKYSKHPHVHTHTQAQNTPWKWGTVDLADFSNLFNLLINPAHHEIIILVSWFQSHPYFSNEIYWAEMSLTKRGNSLGLSVPGNYCIHVTSEWWSPSLQNTLSGPMCSRHMAALFPPSLPSVLEPICPSSRRLVCGSSCFVSLSSSPPQWILNFNKTCSRKLDKFPVTPFLAQPALSLSILQLFIEHQIQARSSRHWWKSCEWIRKKRCLVCMELTS